MNWSAGKIGTIYQKPAQAIGLSTPPIGCVLDLPGLPGGGNKIYDRSPYGNIGTIIGAVWKRLPNGLWCLDFDGSDDYVNCGSNPSLDITDAITVKAWIKLDAIDREHTVICRWDMTNNNFRLYIWANNNIYFAIKISDAQKQVGSSSATLVTNRWYQFVGTYDGSYVKIYRDGILDCTPLAATGSIDTAPVDLEIGRRPTPDGYLDGMIAFPRIYNSALSALEIQNHYQQEKYLFGVW